LKLERFVPLACKRYQELVISACGDPAEKMLVLTSDVIDVAE